MCEGAIGSYLDAGGSRDQLAILEAPGAYELISIAAAAAASGMYESVVCLGCVIRGETSHDQHIASAVAAGLGEISIRHQIPVSFGVLTTNTIEQAQARAGGTSGNKGSEAMDAALGASGAIKAINNAKLQSAPGVRFTPGFQVPDKAQRAGEGV